MSTIKCVCVSIPKQAFHLFHGHLKFSHGLHYPFFIRGVQFDHTTKISAIRPYSKESRFSDICNYGSKCFTKISNNVFPTDYLIFSMKSFRNETTI